MELHVLNHPLVEHKLTVLRDKNTPSSTFRELVSELVMLEAYEATRNLSVVAAPIETPVAPMTGKKLASPRPIIVPVLRAGLGMLDGMTRLIPTAEVGFLGMKRDEAPHPAGDVREPSARGPVRPPVLPHRPDARHRRNAGRRHALPGRARRQGRDRDQHHRGPRRHQVRRGAHRPVHRLQGRGVRGRRTS